MTIPTNSQPSTASASQRLVSVDALRGFDMFWIIGAGALVGALNNMSQTPVTRFLATQLCHVAWEGFHFEDLIFPLFVFIVGVSSVFSLTKALEQGGRKAAMIRIFRRGALLYLLGIFYYGGMSNPWPDIRLSGVLQHIAIAYVAAGLLFCFLRLRGLAIACVGLLVGYWAVMTFVPIRDIQLTTDNLARIAAQAGDNKSAELLRTSGNCSAVKDSPAWAAAEKLFYATTNRVTGVYDLGRNVSDHFDFQYLPARKWDIFFDPQGYLQTIPTTASYLLGVLAGLLLQSRSITDWRKVVYLIVAGVVMTGLGWLWGMQFPVIKKIWTSSYVLVAGGYSALLLGAFYLVVDVWQKRTWCQPFVWMGMNAITIYLAVNIVSFKNIANRLAGGDIRQLLNAHVANGFGDLVVALVSLTLAFWLVRFLYQRKIFLRV
jgi:predicted acyltransferase